MCLQIPVDLDNSTTMFPAAADFSFQPETIEEYIKSLISMCKIGLKCLCLDSLCWDSSTYSHLVHLEECLFYQLIYLKWGSPSYSWVWEQVLYLRKKVEQAYSDAFCNLVFFSTSSAVKEGVYINIGSHRICVPYNLRVNHPLLQMVLFAKNLHGDSFACLKSMAPKRIACMAKASGSSASPTEYIADWISADWKPESPNAVRNPTCGSKKPLLPVLFNIYAIEKTSSTVSVIPQSGDNVKSRPYDSSMTFAEGNCGVGNKSNMELSKAGSRLSFREESKNYLQHSALTGGSHDARLQVPMAQEVTCIYSISLEKMPTVARSVKCRDPHSNSALRVTPFDETAFTPMVPELIEVNPQHLRKIVLASEDDTLKSIYIFIHMMVGSQVISANPSMHDIVILDSGATYHCTGDRSQLSDYRDGVAPIHYLKGAEGTLMRVHGTGSIHNENFQVKGVLYVPGLNNEPNINKTIFSVAKLNELGYSILFNSDGAVSVIDTSKRTWNMKHEIVGKARKYNRLFMVDYLRIPLNRDSVPMLEEPGLLKSLWNASVSVWCSITGRLSQRTTSTQRLPV